MKLTVTLDDGHTEVFQYVTDLYIAVRQDTPQTDGHSAWFTVDFHSYSWGSRLRDLVKEVQQSLIEMQDTLREHRQKDGNSR